MPTYEYACASCDTHHDIVQKMTDPTLTDCPDCGQPTLRKLFNGVGVVFKGSGFYRTDSRSGGSEASGSESKGSESKGSDSKGSDSKGSESKGSESKGKDSSSSAGSTSSTTSTSSTSSTASKAAAS